jgi:transposase
LIHEDEVSFRQDATLYCTWARRGCPPQIPTTGARRSVKIFGCIEIYSARFLYHRETVFNADTYLDFLEQIARYYYPRPVLYIQDNASYHKDKDVWAWFKANRSWWEVHNLPPYWPELNATERLWHHTRLMGTHNRYFANESELLSVLTRVFRSIQRRPQQIRGYLVPFL